MASSDFGKRSNVKKDGAFRPKRHRSGSLPVDGESVLERRLAAGLTQKQLAELANTHREVISRIESTRGGRSTDRRLVAAIAKGLGCEIADLLVGPVSAKPSSAESPPLGVSVGAYVSRLPGTLGPLYGRTTSLAHLSDAFASGSRSTVVIEAEGGAGKTALAARWLELQRQGEKKIRIYDYSFNSDEFTAIPSAQGMLNHACRAFGIPDPEQLNDEMKCSALSAATLLQPTVFVLDGLEVFQHPPGHPNEGRIIDPALRTFLRRQAQVGVRQEALLILTTRLRVRDLEQWEDSSVARISLRGVNLAAAKEILSSYGVRGRNQDVSGPIHRYTKGHPLTLHLLAGYIQDRFSGDGRAWREHGELADVPRAGVDAKWVMMQYERWLVSDPAKLQLLKIISLFDGQVESHDLGQLLLAQPIRGLTDKLRKLGPAKTKKLTSELLRARLLLGDLTKDNRVDMHVIVRDYFRTSLSTNAAIWKRANKWLSNHFSDQLDGEARTADEVLLTYSAIKYACRAGDYRQAHRLYVEKIHGSDDGVVRALGLFGDDLSTLYAFFDLKSGHPAAELSDAAQIELTERIGTRLRWVGRLRDSIEKMQWILREHDRSHKSQESILVASRYVPECHLLRGELIKGERTARAAVGRAQKAGTWIDRMAALTIHAAALHQLGHAGRAREGFDQAESVQLTNLPQQRYLSSVRAHRFHELLLDQGEYAEVIARSELLLQPLSRERIHALDIGPVDQGCAYLGLGLAQLRGRLAEVATIEHHLVQALTHFNDSGRREYIYQGQIALGELAFARNEFGDAIQRLKSVRYECDQDEMWRLVADIDLLLGEAYGRSGQYENASRVVESAARMIQRSSYRRRERRLDQVRTSLAIRQFDKQPKLK